MTNPHDPWLKGWPIFDLVDDSPIEFDWIAMFEYRRVSRYSSFWCLSSQLIPQGEPMSCSNDYSNACDSSHSSMFWIFYELMAIHGSSTDAKLQWIGERLLEETKILQAIPSIQIFWIYHTELYSCCTVTSPHTHTHTSMSFWTLLNLKLAYFSASENKIPQISLVTQDKPSVSAFRISHHVTNYFPNGSSS